MQQCLSARRSGRLLRLLTVLVVVAVAAVLTVSTVAAAEPVRSTFSQSLSDPYPGLCAFDVNVQSDFTVNETDFLNADGGVTRAELKVDEVDTFSAHGNKLVSLPYHYNMHLTFDSAGNVTGAHWTGILEKVPLPDGSLFITAGRLDWLAHGLGGPIIIPDKGNTGNKLDAFCAALSG